MNQKIIKNEKVSKLREQVHYMEIYQHTMSISILSHQLVFCSSSLNFRQLYHRIGTKLGYATFFKLL